MAGAHLFLDAVAERLAGRLKIDWQGGPEVIPGLDQPQAVANGVVDGAFTVGGYYRSLVPTVLMKVATGMTPMEQRESGFIDVFNEQHQKGGFYYLGTFTGYSPFWFYFTKPITSLADFDGRLLRTGGVQQPFSEMLGCVSTVVPLGDTYTALQRGVVDGATAGFTTWGPQWIEVAPYVVTPGYYGESQPDAILFNLDSWNKLPPDIQEELTAIAKEIEPKAYEAIKEVNDAWQAQTEAKGIEWQTLSPEDEQEYLRLSVQAIVDNVAGTEGVTAEDIDLYRPFLPEGFEY